MARNIVLGSFAIGTVAGLRSVTAPAATLGAADSHWTGPARVAAAAELIADKLPATPPRLLPIALAVRVVSGALCGRALAKRAQGSHMLGTVAGAVGSLAGSYAGYYARRYVTVQKHVPDWAIALAEDALAIGLARAATAA